MLLKLLKVLLIPIDKVLFALWRLSGWDYDYHVPDIDKFMLVMAPHTTFRDYFHSIPIAIRERRYPRIMMKKELLDNPFYGWFLKLGGGFGVDRSRSHNTVQSIIHDINQEDRLVFIIAPEGTRQRTTDWKTGFYHIAVGAEIPLVLAYINYETKRIGFSDVYYPTGNIVEDYQWMSAFFAEYGVAKYPDQFALPDIATLKARVESPQPQEVLPPIVEDAPIVTPV